MVRTIDSSDKLKVVHHPDFILQLNTKKLILNKIVPKLTV